DMVETSILAAALEIVDRVGPCEARISVEKIEDTRNLKRKQVLDRAKTLLRTMLVNEIPESKELSDLVRDDAKVADVGTYGVDKLPSGPAVASSEAIIVVEGRADVINLLKNGIKNVVAIGGAKVGKTIAELGKEKEITVFLDGDRGGDIILKELVEATDIDYVCRAPPGKEVEELARKELIKCLRRRTPIEQVVGYEHLAKERSEQPAEKYPEKSERAERAERGIREEPRPQPAQHRFERDESTIEISAPIAPPKEETPEEREKGEMLRKSLKDLEGSLKARLLDKTGGTMNEVMIREIMKTFGETDGVWAVVLDGIVTQRLVDLAEQKGAEYVVGIRSGNVTRRPAALRIVLAE
ncbi:MAG: DNA primase DnaG, partial [Candidatus Micrarchaeota archaeon]